MPRPGQPKPAKPSQPTTAASRVRTLSFTPGADPLVVAPPAIANVAASLAAFAPTPAAYDHDSAKALVEALRSRLVTISYERIVTPRLDVDAACRTLLSVYSLATQAPGVHAWFKSLDAAGVFDIASLDHLNEVTIAVMFAYREAVTAGAFATDAKIPAELDQATLVLEAAMQSVCEHNLQDHPVHGPILRILSPGTGYLDRANDLFGYAAVYEAEPVIVSRDTKYQPTQVADARRLAGEILATLGAAMTPKAREWYDLLQRAWTLLTRMYFEVQEAGKYLLRYDPRRDERFPSLYVVGRPGVGQRKKKVGAGTTPAEGGAPGADGAGQGATGPVK